MPRITVCTPTLDRARTLPRLFESLREQTFRDFEWLVVDDGSTDDTADVVEGLAAEAAFPVRYVRREERGGKHIALNLAVRECAGEFLAVLDSDDWYAANTLQRFVELWDELPDPAGFAEVQGLCADDRGRILGDRFPADVFDSDYYTNAHVLRLAGDRIGMIRVDVLRRYPFPEEFGPVWVPEGIVWNRIAADYRVRGVNEVLGFKEYQDDGITKEAKRRPEDAAGPRLMLFSELLGLAGARPVPWSVRARAYANLTRYALHDGRSLADAARRAPSRAAWLATMPVGAGLYLRDRRASR